MTNIGARVKQAFEILLKHNGCTILIHKSYGLPDQVTTEARGLKNCEKNNHDKVMFQFPEVMDVKVGDVLQQKGARDLWKVIELEDNLHGDVYVNFEAKVKKLSESAQSKDATASQIVVQGSVFGGIQMNSPNAVQNLVVQVTQISEAVGKLREIAEQAPLSELDKEEVILALDRIVQLSQKEKSPSVAARIREKLDLVKSALDVGSTLGGLAAPWIEVIQGLCR